MLSQEVFDRELSVETKIRKRMGDKKKKEGRRRKFIKYLKMNNKNFKQNQVGDTWR